jgi:hypothetical protein
MRESSTYQVILKQGHAEGKLQHARSLLLAYATDILGTAPAEASSVIEAMADVERLSRMIRRVHCVASWQELLQTP